MSPTRRELVQRDPDAHRRRGRRGCSASGARTASAWTCSPRKPASRARPCTSTSARSGPCSTSSRRRSSRSVTIEQQSDASSAIRSPRCATCSARCAGTGHEHEERMRRAAHAHRASTGGDRADEGVDAEHLRCLVEAPRRGRAVCARTGRSTTRSTRSALLTSYPTYERLRALAGAHADAGRGRARQARRLDRRAERRASRGRTCTPTTVWWMIRAVVSTRSAREMPSCFELAVERRHALDQRDQGRARGRRRHARRRPARSARDCGDLGGERAHERPQRAGAGRRGTARRPPARRGCACAAPRGADPSSRRSRSTSARASSSPRVARPRATRGTRSSGAISSPTSSASASTASSTSRKYW